MLLFSPAYPGKPVYRFAVEVMQCAVQSCKTYSSHEDHLHIHGLHRLYILIHLMLHGSEQVKRRCRWLLSFADGELAQLPDSPDDPFHGQRIDGNTLGGLPRPQKATV